MFNIHINIPYTHLNIPPSNIHILYSNMFITTECYDISFGFHGGTLWGRRANPPFHNAEGCKRWIDNHPVLKEIVIARWIDGVENHCESVVGTSVVVVAVLRVYDTNNRQLFDILSRQRGLSFNVTNCKLITNDSVAGRAKARRRSGQNFNWL